MALRPMTKPTTVPLRGGAITVRDAAQLNPGAFSMVQNLRPKHPGFEKRPGSTRLHTTADGTNKVLSLHQFRKTEIDENHVFAQMADNDVLEATNLPPTVTTGAFGTEVFSGSPSAWAASTGYATDEKVQPTTANGYYYTCTTAGTSDSSEPSSWPTQEGATQSDNTVTWTCHQFTPATWAAISDILIHSNGIDQHKYYVGTANYVSKFTKYDHASAAPTIDLTFGIDYTAKVTDGSHSTTATLDALDTYANNECLYVACPVPANRLTFNVISANSNTATMTVKYRKSDATWVDTSATDGTLSSGDTIAVTGTVYWTHPSDEIPIQLYGLNAYWYQIEVSAQLSATVSVSRLTYGTDHDGAGTRTSFIDIENVWDGLSVDVVEVQVYDSSATAWYTYGSTVVELGATSHGAANDYFYAGCADPASGIFLDFGDTPNTTAAVISTVEYWSGTAWTSVGTVVGTATDRNNWITWKPIGIGTEHPRRLQQSEAELYWYRVDLDQAVSTGTIVGITYRPYFDIDDAGKSQTCAAWGDRMCYSFTKWPQFLYIGKRDNPLVLNGPDYGVLEAGDGRTNRILSANKFHAEIIVWQEEKGIDGGCTTLFEGFSPTTYGKLILSSKIGILNSRCQAVVDGVLTSTATEEKLRTLAFWVSRHGVCVSDGRTITIISDDIQNYFDPQESTCIRRGYEQQHWMVHDSAWNVLRIGLVTGTSATVPNTFLVFDLADKVWYFDSLDKQALSCATEVEAGSGDVSILQIGGGTDDGAVYQLNTGTNDGDIGEATPSGSINSYIDIELSARGLYFVLEELLLRCKAQAAGDISLAISGNGVADISETLSMVAEDSGQDTRRHLLSLGKTDYHMRIRLQHNTASQSMSLYDIGLGAAIWDGV